MIPAAGMKIFMLAVFPNKFNAFFLLDDFSYDCYIVRESLEVRVLLFTYGKEKFIFFSPIEGIVSHVVG